MQGGTNDIRNDKFDRVRTEILKHDRLPKITPALASSSRIETVNKNIKQ